MASEISAEIRKAVRERYARLALAHTSAEQDSYGCCGESNAASCRCAVNGDGDHRGGAELVRAPEEALAVSAGCGSPLLMISPRKGDVVLDLGSGGGVDVFRAALLVGPNGKAIGVDATPEMIWRARETAAKYGNRYTNVVEFRLGEIEHLPIESASVDYVISNCVINLSPEKLAVLKESFRVLKLGGVFAVADITIVRNEGQERNAEKSFPLDSWSACIAGAITETEYRSLLERAGFRDIEIEHVSQPSTIEGLPPRLTYQSSHIKARKQVTGRE